MIHRFFFSFVGIIYNQSMNQIFSSKELLKFVKQTDIFEYGYSSQELLENELNEICSQINDREFKLDIKYVHNYFLIDKLGHKLVMRKLNDNIKRIYKDEQANRRIIISQIKILLQEKSPFWILKTDIKKFYESINIESIFSKLKDDAMLSFQSVNILSDLFNNELINSIKGLPRGMNISSILSEIYMRRFDKWIKSYPGVYYYARFVDDIIIFSYSEEFSNSLNDEIKFKLIELAEGLEINEKKHKLYKRELCENTYPLEYLGYKFYRESINNKSDIIVSIAVSKVKKIKSRIVIALMAYCKDSNFSLLEKRIKFLTGNYSIRKNSSGNDLRAGIYYNYSEINDTRVLQDLNIFLCKSVYCRFGSLGRKLVGKFTKTQQKIICKNSFKYGFEKKVYNSFTFEEMKLIIKCWNNE